MNSKNSETGDVPPACLGMKAHSSMASFVAALAPEMRARVDRAAGGGDCRWALLKNQEAQGALLNVFLARCFLLAAPLLG